MGQNMVIIICVLLALLLLWSSIIMKDIINRLYCLQAQKGRRWYAKRHTAWCHNFILRYLYQFFLEFCICVFLQLSLRDYTEVSPRLHYYMAITFCILIVLAVVFVVALFGIGGPWVPGFYTRRTAVRSADGFEHRRRDMTFD